MKGGLFIFTHTEGDTAHICKSFLKIYQEIFGLLVRIYDNSVITSLFSIVRENDHFRQFE